MDEKRQAGFGDGGKCGLQLLLVNHREAVAAGIDEETFETAGSSACERQDVSLIVRDCSAPCCPVDQALPCAEERFSSSAATVVVSGRQFKGISIRVV